MAFMCSYLSTRCSGGNCGVDAQPLGGTVRLIQIATASLGLLAACLQPVDPNARVVASCRGSCPFGECDDACADTPDASCTTSEDCLHAYSCSKSTMAPCSGYRAENFQVTTEAATACAQASGHYCVRTVGSYGGSGKFAVD